MKNYEGLRHLKKVPVPKDEETGCTFQNTLSCPRTTSTSCERFSTSRRLAGQINKWSPLCRSQVTAGHFDSIAQMETRLLCFHDVPKNSSTQNGNMQAARDMIFQFRGIDTKFRLLNNSAGIVKMIQQIKYSKKAHAGSDSSHLSLWILQQLSLNELGSNFPTGSKLLMENLWWYSRHPGRSSWGANKSPSPFYWLNLWPLEWIYSAKIRKKKCNSTTLALRIWLRPT